MITRIVLARSRGLDASTTTGWIAGRTGAARLGHGQVIPAQ